MVKERTVIESSDHNELDRAICSKLEIEDEMLDTRSVCLISTNHIDKEEFKKVYERFHGRGSTADKIINRLKFHSCNTVDELQQLINNKDVLGCEVLMVNHYLDIMKPLVYDHKCVILTKYVKK